MSNSLTLRVRRFTTDTGVEAEVLRERTVGRQGFWTGLGETTREFVRVGGREFDLDGCGFRAESVCRSNGF